MHQDTMLDPSVQLGSGVARRPEPARLTVGRAATWTANGRLSRLYLLAGAVAVACYVLVPPVAGSTWLFEVVGVSAAGAIAVGMVRHRPQPALPWVLFTVAQVLFVTGDFFYYTYDLSFPSFADGLYIGYYPVQAAALLLLIRSRTPGRDYASLLDALIISVGLGLLSWIYLIEPYARDAGASPLSRFVSMAYPSMDVLLLAVAVRLVMGTGARPRAFHLLFASIVCLIVTDATYGAIELGGSYNVGSALDVGWMATYLLWGAAALDPSMRELSARAPTLGASLTGKRVLLLAAATMIAPAVLLTDEWTPIGRFDRTVAAVASAVMFVLVLVRMLGLVSSLRSAVTRHEQAERRETVLRRAASTLTAAPDRDHIRRAAVDGARALVAGLAVDIAVEVCDGEASGIEIPATPSDALVVPLATQASAYGRLVVTPAAVVPTDVVDGLRTLGSQVALALEGAALTEDLSRQRSDVRVGALVQNSSDMIMVLDEHLVFRYVTPSVAQALGHRPEDLVGTPLPALVDPSEERAVAFFFARLGNHPGRSVVAEWRMRRSDGHFTDVEAVSTNLLEDPSVNGIVVTAHDITERKALEVGLQRQVHQLEELDRIRSEFVATVSHELRTPLTSIIGQVELLGEGELGDLSVDQARGVEVIGRNSNRLFSLIEDLLTLSHMETSSLQLQRQPTLVARLVEDVRCQIEPLASAKPVSLTVSCHPSTGTAVVDPDQLDRVLMNLVTNAVKFTPGGGTVALQARREGRDLVFRVSDTGIGIPVDEQSRLFTRFFRSSLATGMAIQGTGLGLVIVKRIVEEHGGTISVISVPDAGTTVTVRIPVGEAVEAGAA